MRMASGVRPHMKAQGALIGFGVLVLTAMASAQVTDAQVEAGINKLKAYLYRTQNNAGHWDAPQPGQGHVAGTNHGGQTALITYALLTAGESYQSPKLRRAIEFLSRVDMQGTYAVAARAHVWSHLPPQFGDKLRDDLYWLQQAAHPVETGGISFRYRRDSKDWDNSAAQYGVLGMWEAAKRDLPVSRADWLGFEKHALATQHDSGAWSYGAHNNDERTSMTTAGLAMLYITQDYLHNQDFRTPGRARKHPLRAAIDRGLGWLDEHYEPGVNVNGNHQHYTMYGIERVGIASGRKYLGGKDWYRTGARWILDHPGTGTNAAFSLLFLERGRVPVFINKLEIPEYDWNNRPSDAARLTAWVSDTVEQQMNWQIVPIGVDPVDWLDAPILYLAGHKPLDLTAEQEQKIKRYIDLGGMLITAADSGSSTFTQSVRQMLKRLYPKYELNTVDPQDELLNVVFRFGANRLNVQSIHNGVRHLAIHIPRDVSWTLHSASHADPTPWQLFTNAYYYATEKGRVRNRLDEHFLARRKAEPAPKLTLARAKYDGNWNPEPLAWQVQANFMHNASRVEVDVTEAPLDKLPNPANTPFVHVVGTEAVTFTDSQIQSIQHYVEAGGVILFENAGGMGRFAESTVAMLNRAFPDERIRPIADSSSIITGKPLGGYDIATIDYRAYALLRMGQVDFPRLLAMNVDDRPRILISSEDLTYAMLDQPVWGVFGYASDSAHRLMTNLLLYAMRGPGQR